MSMKMKANKSHKNPRNCFTHKVRYKDHKLAIAALHSISNRRSADLSEFGQTSFNQVRVYFHDACKGWHLTSQDAWSVSFRSQIDQ
jgi:hypothetical protein